MTASSPRSPEVRTRPRSAERGVTRRDFLKVVAAGGVLAGGVLLARRSATKREMADSAVSTPGPGQFRQDGCVVVVRHPGVLREKRRAEPEIVREMLEAGLKRLTRTGDARDAWRHFFSPTDVIGLKVNCLGAPSTHTHTEVALAAASGLQAAGIPAGNLIIFDRLTEELDRAGFVINADEGVRCFGTDRRGYDREPTVSGKVGSCFSRIVSEDCTALLNLPMVKDHDLAGVSISLKNHFGCIHNPNKLHLEGCCPYVADLNLAPQLRAKQRLIVADALEVIHDGGPIYRPSTTEPYGALLVGTDPVALDRVGWQIIDGLRAQAGLRSLAAQGREPRYISVAGDPDHKLGVAELSSIEVVEVPVS